MATTNTVRITKAQKYDGIIALLEGKSAISIPGKDDKAGVTMDATYLMEFCKAEKALLAKKNTTAGGNKKLTKNQEKNETFKKVILSYLAANPALVVTATDVMEKVLRPTYPAEIWSNQKAASLLNALCDKVDKDSGEIVSEGVLDRIEGKGKTKTTFKIKSEYAVEAEDADTEDDGEVEDIDSEEESDS